jgi:hypothetical protein
MTEFGRDVGEPVFASALSKSARESPVAPSTPVFKKQRREERSVERKSGQPVREVGMSRLSEERFGGIDASSMAECAG